MSEMLFKRTLDTLPVFIAYIGDDERYRHVNKEYARWLELSETEIVGKLVSEVLESERYRRVKNYIAMALLGKKVAYEVSLEGGAGEQVFFARYTPFLRTDGSVDGFSILVEDITEKKEFENQNNILLIEEKRLEEELYQAQKLESLGQLAAGIAHEINTPCQYISDNTTYLADAIAKMEPLMREIPKLLELAQKSGSQAEASDIERIQKIYEAADIEFLLEEAASAADQSQSGMEKIQRVVVAMKEFAHPVDEGVLADINEMIANILIVSHNAWKNIAELVTDYDEALPQVYCVPAAINQVFLNIIINAAHAIADVVTDGELGKLTVSTSIEDDQVLIKIADTGPGMTDDVRKRIFDPFFTTKEVGTGTGHGLAISHKIIREDHKGSIEVESTPGEGSCFTIRLPTSATARS